MFAFKMLWIFFNIFYFTVILCVKIENQEEIKDNFTKLEVEEASGENLEFDQALFNTFIENWEETDNDFLNVTNFSDNLNDNEHSDTLNFNDSSSATTDEWNTNESLFGITEKYEFVSENSTYTISDFDILNRWLQEEEEEMKSLDFDDYDSEKLNDSSKIPETFTAKPELNEESGATDKYKTINFQNNGQILNLTVVTVSDKIETTTILNRQNFNNTDVNDKKNQSQNFGIIRSSPGVNCFSFNFTFHVFFEGSRLSLFPVDYVEGNCSSSNSFIKFKWLKADNRRFNVMANFKIACDTKNCFINGIDVELEEIKNGKKLSASKENLHLFESKPGDVYKNVTVISLQMNQNLKISLSNVTFYVAENLNSNELTFAQGFKFSNYYAETIASVVGFAILVSFTIYIIYILRKIKKSKGDFIPSST